jgi:hypothetical protein
MTEGNTAKGPEPSQPPSPLPLLPVKQEYISFFVGPPIPGDWVKKAKVLL